MHIKVKLVLFVNCNRSCGAADDPGFDCRRLCYKFGCHHHSAEPIVIFVATEHHHPLVSAELYRLMTEEREQHAQSHDMNVDCGVWSCRRSFDHHATAKVHVLVAFRRKTRITVFDH